MLRTAMITSLREVYEKKAVRTFLKVLSHLACKFVRNQKPENYAANLQNDLNILVPGSSI
jgi:hypothetical protein